MTDPETMIAAVYRECSVESCSKNSHHSVGGMSGVCPMHYRRMKKFGTYFIDSGTRDKASEWMDQFLASAPWGDECIAWPFYRDRKGYARFKDTRIKGVKTCRAHRYVCLKVKGEPPADGYHAAHSCGKGHEGCINPNHLWWKTPAQNLEDKIGHGTFMFGDKHPNTKISDEDVVKIRLDARSSGIIARDYGVQPGQIQKIKRGVSRLLAGRST